MCVLNFVLTSLPPHDTLLPRTSSPHRLARKVGGCAPLWCIVDPRSFSVNGAEISHPIMGVKHAKGMWGYEFTTSHRKT